MTSKKGKIYEAMFMVALEDLASAKKLKGKIFWNEKPTGMTIEPDFTIGPDKDNPDYLFLVTHSGSTKDSEKKFWRNIGELMEAKVRLPKAPRVYCITFDGTIKADLKTLQDASFDGQLLIADAANGKALVGWVDKHQKLFPDDSLDKVKFIQKLRLNPAHTPLSLGLRALSKDLETLVRQGRPELDSLWNAERARPVGKAPAMRPTYLRRGGGKLLLLDKYDQVDATGKLDARIPADLKAALLELGLAKNSVGGLRFNDSEVLWVLSNLTLLERKELHSAHSSPRVKEWVEALRGLSGIKDQLAYLQTHWENLITGQGLFSNLKQCHTDPHLMCPTAVPKGSKRVWLFHLAVEWIKLQGGARASYGLAVVVDELAVLASDPSHKRTVASILGRSPQWQAKHTIGLGLTDWHSSSSKQCFAFTDDDLARVSDVLARRLSKCSPPNPASDSVRVRDAMAQTVLEAKLLTYRNFQPHQQLLAAELNKAGKTGTIVKAMRACFAEAAEARGAKLDPRSSGTTVMRVKNTLINWQSCSDEGRDHKKKELCGRAPALRYVWDKKANSFVPRPGVQKLVLIVDGTWRQADLNALVRAVWDEV